MATGTPPPATFGWSDGSIGLTIEVDAAGTARVVRLGGSGSGPAPAPGSGPSRDGTAAAGLPLVDVVLTGEGRAWSGRRYCESVAGPRLRYRGHEDRAEAGGWHELRVDLADPVTGLAAEVFYRILAGSGAMRSWVRLSNLGADPVTVESVTSFLCGLVGGPAGPEDLGGLDILWAENDWLAEGRWQRRPLRDALPDLNRRGHGADPRGRFGITSAGTWSSGTYLPMGGLVSRDAGHAWIWQIEHNGAWHWQVGEYARRRTGPGEAIGLTEVFDRIRAEGMIPGLWLEPEVVGLRSPVAEVLPAEAFFTRHGRRVVENGRYHLDLRHPAARKHLNETIDFLVGDLGAGYLKLDYNINGGPGTDSGKQSAGAGLLACNRAHLDWLDAVLDRHPGLVIENCASGGMRADYALLSRLQLQSTSDQQDYFRYPPIAAAAPAAIAPEQAAVWAYPQPGFTDDEIAFTMASAMLGRVHLSGHLDLMSPAQLALVASAVRVYKELRGDIARSVPFWPLGLPAWEDPWIALGLRGPEVSYLTVWQRGRQGAGGGPPRVTLPVPALRGQAVTPRIMYSGAADAEVAWDASRGVATVTLPRTPSACVLSLR